MNESLSPSLSLSLSQTDLLSLSQSYSFLPSLLANIGHWNHKGISFPLTDIYANKAAATAVLKQPTIHKEERHKE